MIEKTREILFVYVDTIGGKILCNKFLLIEAIYYEEKNKTTVLFNHPVHE